MKEATKIVVESQLNDIQTAIEGNPEKREIFRQHGVLREFETLKEQLTSDDWGRLGVLAGLLWYKLDSLIKHFDDAGTTLKAIERNTARR